MFEQHVTLAFPCVYRHFRRRSDKVTSFLWIPENCFSAPVIAVIRWSIILSSTKYHTFFDEVAYLLPSQYVFFMDTPRYVQVELPKTDTAFLKSMAKRMGWKVKSNRRRLSSYERSLRDLDEGRIYKYDSLDDLIKEIERSIMLISWRLIAAASGSVTFNPIGCSSGNSMTTN